jgi:hypothetical protein
MFNHFRHMYSLERYELTKALEGAPLKKGKVKFLHPDLFHVFVDEI